MTTHGFSTGIGDCVVDVNKDDIEPLLQQIDYLRTSENEINQSLNRIRDNVGTAIQQKLSPFHGMKCMVESGSKGSMVNICQMAGCVGQQNIEEGDEIIITELEHHSNYVPWNFLRERKKAVIKFAPINEDGDVIISKLEELITSKTKIIAVTHL